jgi:PleD family two-component response regulator
MTMTTNNRVTASDILKVVPITRKTLWLWQKKYKFFPDPIKKVHPGGRGIIGYYPAWVEERCKKIYSLQRKGHTISMIKEILQKEEEKKIEKKILIIGSESQFCELLVGYLKENDFAAEVALDGFEAGLKTREFKPSIIILNIMYSGVDGVEVCKSLKSRQDTSAIKIIVMSKDLRDTESEVLGAGADMFFIRPVDFGMILKTCNDFIAAIGPKMT